MQLFMWRHDTVGWRSASGESLVCSVPFLMLLMVHQPHLRQPWRLDLTCQLPFLPNQVLARLLEFSPAELERASTVKPPSTRKMRS